MKHLPTKKEQIYGLDLLRGLCAIMIAAYHILSWDNVIDFTAVGYYGVYIFFVLSGFAIHYQYKDRLIYIEDLTRFFALRFVRLFPLLFLVASFNYLNVPFLSDSYYWLILTSSCLFGFAMPGATSAITGGWSLGIEFGLYIFYPFLLSLCRTLKIYILFLLILLLLRISFVKISYLQFQEYWWFGYTQILPFIFFFLSGMYCAEIYKKNTWINYPFLRNIFFIIALSFLGLLLIYNGVEHQEILDGWTGCVLTLHSVICVFLFSYLPVKTNYFIKICEFFGKISYGVYLLHPIVYKIINKLHFVDAGWQSLIVCIFISILSAHFIKKIFEDPIRLACRLRIEKPQHRELLA